LNQAGVTGASPANTVPGTAYTPGVGNPAQGNYAANAMTNAVPGFQQGTYPGTATAATRGYTGRVMPGMAGYNAMNPMGTTMAPSYYAGTTGMPYATSNTPGYAGTAGMPSAYRATTAYPRTYMNPGYSAAQIQGYPVQRRGLFGRRNRIAYPASPYANSTYGTYAASPYRSYTYGTYPAGTTTYGTTTYYTSPGTYTYGR
jgi:hypothetical protein